MLDSIIILGIICSIIYYEITEISPGGIIVPGYLALFLNQPARILMTIAISLIVLFTVQFLSKYTILYGKRKFAIMIIVSFILRYFIGKGMDLFDLPVTTALIIGYLIPGIIAKDMDNQGIVKTISSMLVVTITLKFLIILYKLN